MCGALRRAKGYWKDQDNLRQELKSFAVQQRTEDATDFIEPAQASSSLKASNEGLACLCAMCHRDPWPQNLSPITTMSMEVRRESDWTGK
jgi:hypothetical protein